MIVNTLVYLVFVSLVGFVKSRIRFDRIIAWMMFFSVFFLFYNYIEQILSGLKQGFSFIWGEAKIGKLTIDFFPSSITNQLLVPIFFVSLLTIFNNNVFRYEERRSFFNSLIILNLVVLSLLICAQNYVQLITAIFISDIIGYILLKDVDSSRRYVIYNFFADMCLFMVLSMVSGMINSLEISKLFTYDQIGRHKDFVGIVTCIALFVKVGAFSFEGYLLDASHARFQRMSTVHILFSPLSGILLLLKLHNLLTVSDLFLPIYEVISYLTFITGCIFFVLQNNIRQKQVYFNMAYQGALLILIKENSFGWTSLFSYLYFVLFLYNTLFFKLYLYQNRTDNVSDMINAKEMNTDIMFVILLLITLLTNLFISIMYKISYFLSDNTPFYLSIILSLSLAIVLNHIYKSPTTRRLDYLNKNPMRILSFILTSIMVILLTYHFKTYNLANFILIGVFFVIISLPILGYFRKFYTNNILQQNNISTNLYYYILALPLIYISRMLWLMVDTVFSEKIIENLSSKINRLSISMFFKFNKKGYANIILSIIIGMLIFVISFLKGDLP